MHLFGTDGIRSIEGEGIFQSLPLFIQAFVKVAKSYHVHGVIIGRDSRPSGKGIKDQLHFLLTSSGMEVYHVEIAPTAVVSMLCMQWHQRNPKKIIWGIVISASHNPYYYNGLKFFQHHGYKLSSSVEKVIEDTFFAYQGDLPESNLEVNPLKKLSSNYSSCIDMESTYLHFVKSHFPAMNFQNMHIALDCAYGAASYLAPFIFSYYSNHVHVFADARNSTHPINDGVGAMHPGFLQLKMKQGNFDIGFSFDGDADRVLVFNKQGKILDGDHIIALFLEHYLENAQSHGVVGTYITSLGLEDYCNQMGVDLHRTRIGDKFIFEKMQQTGGFLGGEYSGHIICRDILPMGDGILNALRITAMVAENSTVLHDILRDVPSYYTVNKSLPNRNLTKEDWEYIQKMKYFLKEQHGLLVVRPSGTEPILRIWATGRQKESVDDVVASVCKRFT